MRLDINGKRLNVKYTLDINEKTLEIKGNQRLGYEINNANMYNISSSLNTMFFLYVVNFIST